MLHKGSEDKRIDVKVFDSKSHVIHMIHVTYDSCEIIAYLFSEFKLSVSFINKNLAPESVSWAKCFKSKSSPMSGLP